MSKRRALLLSAVLPVALPVASARAYEIWIDLNTYVEGREGGQGTAVNRTTAFAGADGVWLITDNAYGDNNLATSTPPYGSGIATDTATGFTLAEWRQMVGNIAGASAKIATEDNPAFGYPGSGPHPNNQSYNDAVAIKGGAATNFTLTDFFQYNETGSTTGGTILSTAAGSGKTVNGTTYGTQVQTYAATHGGKIGYLTRGYSSSGWVTPTEAAAADPLVSAGVMETVNLEGQNTAAWINSVTQPLYSGTTLVRPAKPAYVLLTTGTFRNLPGLYYLKQYAPDAVASGMVKFVLNNDYSTTSTAGDGSDGYGFFGTNTTAGADARDTVEGQQQLLNALKTAVPVETWQWKVNGSSTWNARANWSVTPNTGTESSFRSTQNGPANKWDAAAFTSATVTGNRTITVDTAGAKAVALYFDGVANYTLTGISTLTLAAYGTVGADGRVPTVSGAIPTGPSTDATAYQPNIIPIQIKGIGTHTIGVQLTIDPTNAVGLLIDNQKAGGTEFHIGSPIDANGLPIYVMGTGNTTIGGRIGSVGNPSTVYMNGPGTLTLGQAVSGANATLVANGGTTVLNATLGSSWATDAVLDIGPGAVVRQTGTTVAQLNPSRLGPNLTINSGGTFDLTGRGLSVTALAGTSGLVTNNGSAAGASTATLLTGANNQSGSFAGTLANGLFNGTTAAALAVIKAGTGTQTLSGSNAFTGGTTVNGGVLAAASDAALGSGTVAVNGVGAAAAANAGTLALAGGASVANAVLLQGPRNDPASASPGAPHVLNVSGNNTLASNLTLTTAGGLGVLVRSDAGTLTLSGSLTNNNNPGYARPYILYGNGDGRLTGTIANGTGSTAVTKQGSGTWSIEGTAAYTGPTLVQGGTLRLGKNAFAPVLTGAGGADVQTGKLVFDYTGTTSPAATIRGLLAASEGTGFTSASARLRSSTATAARGLGYVDDGTTVTVMATLYGDTDLNGRVAIADFNAFAVNFGQTTGKVWTGGDFDYDGDVDIADFNRLAVNFGQSLPAAADWAPLLAFAAAHDDLAAFAAVTGVPEPTLVGVAVFTATLASRRRRSNHTLSTQ